MRRLTVKKFSVYQGKVFVVVCILLFLCIPTSSFLFCGSAAASANKVYLTPKVTSGIWAKDPVTVNFVANEELCRRDYGNDWNTKCTAWLGKQGSTPQGLVTRDWPEGEWIWQSPTSMQFTPTSSWESDTTYTLHLASLPLPPRVELSQEEVSLWQIPLSAQIGKANVWIDPSPKAEHALSFEIQFTTSISDEKRSALQENTYPVSKSADLVLGRGKWVWLDDNTRAVVNSPILSLPKQKSTVSLSLPDIRPLWLEDNTWHFPQRNVTKDLIVDGTSTLFSLKQVDLETQQNKSLQMEQHLVFRFTQRVGAEELLQALSVVELPLHRSDENIVPTDWEQGGIDADIRQKSRTLHPERVRLAGESDDVLRFRLDASPDRYILWNVEAGFGPTNDQGIKTPLAHSLEGVEHIPSRDVRLQILQAGTVLMEQSNLAIMSDNVDSIRYSAYRFKDTALALPHIRSLDQSLRASERNAISEVARGEIKLAQVQAGDGSYTSSPVFSMLQAKEIFGGNDENILPGIVYLHLKGIKDGEAIVEEGRILMRTEMGLVLKKLPDGSLQAYVCALKDAKPLENVRVQVLGYNSLPVAEVHTDATGKALLPNLDAFKDEKEPVAVLARHMTGGGWRFAGTKDEKVEDMLWLSLQDYERYINLSNFADLGGKQTSANTLNAFVFAERGFFRPKESLNFGTLLRANNWQLLPQTLPLVATIEDETGRTVFEQSFMAGDSIHSFTWPIPANALTGTYTLSIKTPSPDDGGYDDDSGLLLGTTSVRVENFMPDTLRLKTELVSLRKDGKQSPLPAYSHGWLVTSQKADMGLHVQLDTLFGQVAKGRRISSTMRLSSASLYFKGYEDYTFQDVAPFFATGSKSISRPLKGSITDNKGQALLPLSFHEWRFGTLQCSLTTEGYEAGGGRAVSQEKRFLLSSMPYMLGYKAGEGAHNKDFIMKDSVAKLQFQAVDSQLKPIQIDDLHFSIAKRHTARSLISDAQGQYTYAETPVDTQISQSVEKMSADGSLLWNIPTQNVGDYVLTVKQAAGADAQSAEDVVLAQVAFSIVGNEDLRPALKRGDQLPTAHLQVKSDKKHYSGGEEAKLMLTAPYEGVALISLERESVVAHKWVKLPVGTSMHSIAIPEEFTGRGYIQVLMGRSAQSDNIFIQPQSVAMTSITVNTAKREIPLQITVQESMRPNETMHWHIANTQKQPTKAILFAVDEGILQLSRFVTPDPLNHLLLDRALEVRTAQLFDRFMPEDSKILKHLSAFGGGEDGSEEFAALLGTFQNPFKRKQDAPVVWWSGVIEIPAEGLDVEVPISDYFSGSVRLMAVAQNVEAVGSASANVRVQDEQVLAPQVPTTVALGDRFVGGLHITNTTDAPLELSTSLELAKDSAVQDVVLTNFDERVTLAPKQERYLPFSAKVGQEAGELSLLFSTEDAGGVVRKRATSISVRPAVLPRTTQRTFTLNQSADIHAERALLSYAAQNSISISPIPLPVLQGTLRYLQHYPYTCVEQSISKAFPLAQLAHTPYYNDIVRDMPRLQGEGIEKIFANARNALISAFNDYQGVSLWEDRQETNLFLSAYAADYLLNLKDVSRDIPPGMMPQIFETLENSINTSPQSLEDLRAMAYASWVLARAGYVVSRSLELCENFIRNQGYTESDIYNTLMAGAYAELYMQDEAQRHLEKVWNNTPQAWAGRSAQYNSGMFDVLSQYGLHTRIIAKYFPDVLEASVQNLQESLLEGLNRPHATLGASMTALALMDIMDAQNGADQRVLDMSSIAVSCGMFSAETNTQAKAEVYPQMYTLDAPSCTRFDAQVNKQKAGSLFAQWTQHGYDIHMPRQKQEQGVRIEQGFTLINPNGLDTELTRSIEQGQVVRVDVDVTLLNNGKAPVSLVSLLPGGFELVLDHDDDTSPSYDISLMRDEDRVIAFVDATRDTRRITYHMRAVTEGDFALPAAYAEGLFDTSLQSHTVGRRIAVIHR